MCGGFGIQFPEQCVQIIKISVLGKQVKGFPVHEQHIQLFAVDGSEYFDTGSIGVFTVGIVGIVREV